MKDVVILAIESSCDESACAIVKNGKEILSNVVATQIEVHEKFGGVLPEVASRLHVEKISAVVEEALEEAKLSVDDVDAIAYTRGPGLIGSLHVGVQAAKTLAWAYQKPLIPIHHIKAHIFANHLITDLKFPLLSLVVSGGHSEIVLMSDEGSYEILGQTQDDAIGEAYDKVARVLDLGYPGGPKIDKLAKDGEAVYKLPQPKTEGIYDLSFSGLKSGVLQFIDRMKRKGEVIVDANLAASFQETALNEIMEKLLLAVDHYDVKQVLLAGGVAANSALRKKMETAFENRQEELVLPPLWCCTDNAAMVAVAGYFAFINGERGTFEQSAKPSLRVNEEN
ncbi:N6-L-threonylcarbamoyladenine synthase [Breznakia sp. PF5-3]|uniref:tRNA (adenosine(37)-N6)-threonylcarbamoyltransferase complex transferase subunit TsaD n=1 Tax=unclassified Breznakia TaxID=2623764 RepID=UPI0024070D7A|nr:MULTISPECIES: tRNA (adenosine(37)-N6)-threonylcarbamoyltransferase complex transferase subunit TsaD [unclassified Breznakia]MDF9824475.1 N6-L-threonylcarbamoyladenine synthase [Breznakia sp. PM6-1]MDF9835242.1 N6-L-threonylcarbamoyladenine synthase [Breznakia sp. PF5-3]MDF9837430.1 N6-L-threonylcarbamoyladenine synthase [Breznakia sp. PFB2-8]MDF9859366.1 N6-L-threonylcarbamoyladenine synthase [Breznakia sp. PH5-24]